MAGQQILNFGNYFPSNYRADSKNNNDTIVSEPNSDMPRPFGGTSGRKSEFPVGKLGLRGSEMVHALHQKYQAPKALCAQSVLCVMSTTVSSLGLVEAIYGSGVPLSLYLITVAQSGERKTAVDTAAQRGIKIYEKEIAKALAGARQAMSDKAGSEMQPHADIIVNEPTYEGLLGTMSRGQGFACLSNDDAAGFFGGHAMSRDNRQKTIAGLSQIWSGSDVKRPRSHGRDTVVSDVPLSMSLMFQPYLISQVYGDREMIEQGILPRILPCYPETTMGGRLFRECADNVDEEISSFAKRVFDTLVQVKTINESRESPKDPFAPHLSTLQLSSEAKATLIEFHDEVEVKLAPGGGYEKIRGFASRAAENATRIAGIISLFDNIRVDSVTSEAALGACDLMRFYLDEFSYLLSLGKSQKDESAAANLGLWIAQRYGANGIGHDKDVSQFGPPAFRKKGDRQEAMQMLISHRWIEMLPRGTKVDGVARAEAFRVSDKIGEVI